MNGTYLKFQKLNSQRMSRMGKVACHFIAAKLWLRERGKKKGEEFHIRWKKREKMISLSVRSRNNVSREKGGQVLNKSVPSSCKLVLPDNKYETTSISADRQTKIVVYALIQRFDFHELCNHEISLNGRFIHRYRVYRISWNRREKNWLYRKLYIENT